MVVICKGRSWQTSCVVLLGCSRSALDNECGSQRDGYGGYACGGCGTLNNSCARRRHGSRARTVRERKKKCVQYENDLAEALIAIEGKRKEKGSMYKILEKIIEHQKTIVAKYFEVIGLGIYGELNR